MNSWTPTARLAAFVALLALPACGDVLTPFSGGGSPVATVEVSPDRASVEIGETQQYTAVARDSDGDTVTDVDFTWSTSNSSVATVNSDGVATGRGGGPAWIIARAGAAVDSAEIVVEPSPGQTGAVVPTTGAAP